MFILSPFILAWKLKLISNGIMRKILAYYCFRNYPSERLNELGLHYSESEIPRYINEDTWKLLQNHKKKKDKIVIVSASLDVYLKPWCAKHGFDLICNTFMVKNKLITGKFKSGDCNRKEKAARIKKTYKLEKFDRIYAYGDTSDDLEMLELADIKYFKGVQVS